MWSSCTESEVLNTLCSQGEGKRSSRGAQFPSVWGSCSERMCVGGLTDDVMMVLQKRRDTFCSPAEVKTAPLTCSRGIVSYLSCERETASTPIVSEKLPEVRIVCLSLMELECHISQGAHVSHLQNTHTKS